MMSYRLTFLTHMGGDRFAHGRFTARTLEEADYVAEELADDPDVRDIACWEVDLTTGKMRRVVWGTTRP